LVILFLKKAKSQALVFSKVQQEIMLLKIKAYENSRFTEEEFQREEKEIRAKYAYRYQSDKD